ncbi:hypothetical protein ACHAW6_008141 [Cyclotella cf. meneghiniana]
MDKKKKFHTISGKCLAIVAVMCILSAVFVSRESFQIAFLESKLFVGTSQVRLAPIHVAFGLSGNNPGFLSEFEVALKSVLLNAPLERDLFVHILADRDAFAALEDIYNKTELATWVTRNQVEIHSYNVTPYLHEMESIIMETWKPSFPEVEAMWQVSAHTVGAYFRLFLHRFLPAAVDHVLYIDTDVTILTNLEALWRIVEARPEALLHWGRGTCSCFVVMKLSRIEEIWSIARKAPLSDIRSAFKDHSLDDQLILISVNVTHPSLVNVLPGGFDMTLTNRWQGEHFPYHKVYPNTFMLHHNGNPDNNAYWNSSEWIPAHRDSWGLMEYYIHLPWSWARFFADSELRTGSSGYLISFVVDPYPEWRTNQTNAGLYI